MTHNSYLRSCNDGDCFTMPEDYDCSWEGRSPEDTFNTLYGDDCIKLTPHMWQNACYSDVVIGGIVVGIALFGLFTSVSQYLVFIFCLKFKRDLVLVTLTFMPDSHSNLQCSAADDS